ncbi:ATP-binding protein [Quadrisphaera sp. INWT6]|uniref:ATP-binding protein n=1 Tax=Quadrisphaera sp. INWT6 TaxID=2596917 RepID=UPI00281640A7|nr:ATP-binding protein [Quadrisphaera sp. INWT6]
MCDVTPSVSLTLPMDLEAPARARAFVEEAHCPVHASRVLTNARWLVSELVTNAVRHGSPPITTEIECRGEEGMHVRVSDGSADAPVVRDLGHDAQSGRGLALVDLLSSQWGVEPGAAGKAVWFRIGDASY